MRNISSKAMSFHRTLEIAEQNFLYLNVSPKKMVICFKNLVKTSEAATGGVLLEKMFLEISQNSQESTYVIVSF